MRFVSPFHNPTVELTDFFVAKTLFIHHSSKGKGSEKSGRQISSRAIQSVPSLAKNVSSNLGSRSRADFLDNVMSG